MLVREVDYAYLLATSIRLARARVSTRALTYILGLWTIVRPASVLGSKGLLVGSVEGPNVGHQQRDDACTLVLA